jgi:hypothetical protein
MADAPLQPKVKAPGPEPRPDGWWSLALAGTRPGVVKAIADAADVPDAAKTYLRSIIDGFDASLNFVKVDAHFHVATGKEKGDGKGKTHFSLTVNPSTVLT